jgi:hypothetical protein
MQSYLRIIITGMVALCVTISSFAGAKKCYKKTAKYGHYLIQLQKQGGHGKEDRQPSPKEYCTPSFTMVDNPQEEEGIIPHPKQVYITKNFPFQEQDYANPPFAPPRFSHLIL